jgi:hypothetical protein
VPAVLAAVLLAMLTGATRVGAWTQPHLLPSRLGDLTFVSGDRLFLVGSGPESSGTKIVMTYALPAGTLLSRTTVTVPAAVYDVTAVAGIVFVSYQTDAFGAVATVAVAAGTDRELWRRPAQVVAVSRPAGLALLRENHFAVGALHWYAVDLASGVARWTLTQPIDGYIAETGYADGFPRRLVSLEVTGRLAVRDTLTGAVVAAITIPAPADWARSGVALWPDDDLILVGDHTTATAYTLSGLTERWRAPVDLYTTYVGSGCVDVVCLFSPGGTGIQILDRATGRVRWSSDRWAYGEQLGRYLLVSRGEPGPDQPPDVVDSRTGRLLGSLRPWQSVGAARHGGVIALRPERVESRVWYGLLDPVRLSTRLLGVAERVYGDCQTTPDVLICRRIDGPVGIWRFARSA